MVWINGNWYPASPLFSAGDMPAARLYELAPVSTSGSLSDRSRASDASLRICASFNF